MVRNAGVVRNPRSSILLLAAVIGAAGFLGRIWLGERTAPGALRTPVQAASVVPADRVVHFEIADATDDVSAPAATANEPRRVEQLSPAESTLFATTCDLHLLAGETELDLTTRQWTRLAEIVVQTQAVRHNYEATIAVAHETAPGRYRLEIPVYAAAGDELRRQFLADLQNGLGKEAAAEVMEKLGRQLESRFAGFGVGAQTLEITGDPARAPADVQVARTARYWNSVEGSERVTTRREVTFPASEDPTGDNWHALLALISTAS